MQYWLLKSEPDIFGYPDLERLGRVNWDGVRNYQARNHLRAMQLGDLALIYHSSTKIPGVAGVAKVVTTAHPDPSQFDPKSQYYDPKSTLENPRWVQVTLEPVRALELLPLRQLRQNPRLEGMIILRTGNRLSVTPVESAHYFEIVKGVT
ncbi:MAG: EVE domain-containing protein [Deinococcales bacterium]